MVLEAQSACGGSILVIDDDDGILALVEAVLTEAGYRRVLTRANAQEALRTIDLSTIDVVLLDVLMPDTDGIETLGQIRRQWPELPIVVMSGSSPASIYLRMAKQLGATDVLLKPFAIDVLLAMIQRLVGRRRAVQGGASEP